MFDWLQRLHIVLFTLMQILLQERHVKFYLQISGNYEYDIQINIFRFWDWLNKNLSNRNAKWRRLWKFSREAIQISNFSRGGRRPPLNRSKGGAAPLHSPLNTPLTNTIWNLVHSRIKNWMQKWKWNLTNVKNTSKENIYKFFHYSH